MDCYLIHSNSPQLGQKLFWEICVRFGNTTTRQRRIVPSSVMTQQQLITQTSV
jgi:hypothetical protein